MLIEFSVSNYLSFKDKVTLDMVATTISEFKNSNVVQLDRVSLLKGAVVYGANSSGKSNLFKAMSTMWRLVKNSFEQSSTSDLGITPFLLSTETEGAPSVFEVLFIVNGIRYRYGFEITNEEIKAEWLFESKKIAEKPLFIREEDGIEIYPGFKEGKGLEEKTRDNALFLAVVDQFNGVIARRVMSWFTNFVVISGLSHEHYSGVTFDLLDELQTKPLMEQFFSDLDLGFDKIKINSKAFDPKELPKDMPDEMVKDIVSELEGKEFRNVNTIHKKFNNENLLDSGVDFDLRSQESTGTNKLFNISGPIFDVLNEGGTLVVDELDSSLHPLLTLSITKLFNSKEHNPKNAQLIFSTHDTNLFSYGQYRRDQIYFVEKDRFGATDLYSLVEYKEENGKKVRKDRSFEADYIEGRYGAIPFVGNVSKVIKEWLEK